MDDLAGAWSGAYEMTTGSRRSGSIMFELQAGRDTASGTVVMTFESSDPGHATIPDYAHHMRSLRSQALAISFVRLVGAEVTGTLEPYTDPYCGCRLRTTFTGTVRGSVIEGTFVTVHLDSGHTDRGRWKVSRSAGSN
jgi:hypothetical protein